MDKIYVKDNYIVTELGGVTSVFGKNYTVYSENTTTFFLNSAFPINNQRSVTIDFSRVTSIYNEAGTVAYTTSTLRSFFLANTGFKSPVGGSTGITVGTTPITSGVDGRVLFQSGGVVSQDSVFFWDNTNKRLGVGTSTPIGVIHSAGSITASSGIGRGVYLNNTVVASANNNTLVGVDVDPTLNTAGFGGVTSYAFRVNGASIFTNNISIGNGSLLNGMVITANSTATGKTIQTYGGHPLILNGLGNNVTIGSTTAGARLDVRAQGALSTDIAFRVRNSADTADIWSVRGDGNVYLDSGGRIYGNSTNPYLRLSNASGTEMGYGTNYIGIGGAGYNFHINASTAPLRYRTSTGMRISDNNVNATDSVSDGLQAVLALTSTTRGFLPPRMTTTQRNAISAPPAGLMVYDTTDNKHYGYNGTTWNALY